MESADDLYGVIHLHSPKEKYWGLVQRNSPAGVWMTGVDLKSLEEWLQCGYGGRDTLPIMSTSFFPMYRVEKISLDEAVAEIPSLAETIARRCDITVPEICAFRFAPPEGVQ